MSDRFWRWFDNFTEPYKPLIAELSKAFGTDFYMVHTGGGAMAIECEKFEGNVGVMITEAEDVLGYWDDRTDTTGYACGVYPIRDCDCWLDGQGIRGKCEHPQHPPSLDTQEAVGWASSPAANTTAQLVKLIRIALASVGQDVPIGQHIDPALLGGQP